MSDQIIVDNQREFVAKKLYAADCQRPPGYTPNWYSLTDEQRARYIALAEKGEASAATVNDWLAQREIEQ